ncbi:MAG: glycosyltransferase involved in cell wall biosynthesis [Bacteroidia bacterium]|jgi:glycosyltransferase involved in cell wall biosynthesis
MFGKENESSEDPISSPWPPVAPAEVVGSLDVTVVVPIQSDEAEVRQVLQALGDELNRASRTWEIFFVFDGVQGAAWEQAEELRKEFGKRVRTIVFKNAFGESVCLSAAVEKALGRIIVTSPQYVQVDPIELGDMLDEIDKGADFVAPWRHPRIDPMLNRVQSVLFNFVIRMIIGMSFHDLNCYFRAIRREVLEDVVIYGDMYRFLPVIAYRRGYRVVEVKVRHLQEWGRAGFFGVGVYIRRLLDILAVMFLTKFTLKPLRFFGTLGGVITLSGTCLGIYLGTVKMLYGKGVAGDPLLLIAVLLIVLGVQIIGFGLVGEIIIFSQARNLKEYRIERIWE